MTNIQFLKYYSDCHKNKRGCNTGAAKKDQFEDGKVALTQQEILSKIFTNSGHATVEKYK